MGSPPINANHAETPIIQSCKPPPEERFYHEQAYKEPVAAIARIEEVAKFLIGAATTTSGLYLAAFKLTPATRITADPVWILPYLCGP